MFALRPRTRLRCWTAALAERLMPRLAHPGSAVTGGRFERFLVRQILFARQQRSLDEGDLTGIEKALHEGWRRDISDFFDATAQRNEGWYFSQHQPIVQALQSLDRRQPVGRVVEVGCGNGFVLNHLSQVLPGVREWIGLDINEAVIERNRARYRAAPTLRFVPGDMTRDLPGLIVDDTLLLAYGGVLEYLSPASLAGLLRHVATGKRRTIALVEPVDAGHDLGRDAGSHVFGDESSFSHNHQAMLEQAGLRVLWKQENHHDGIRWMMMIAAGPG